MSRSAKVSVLIVCTGLLCICLGPACATSAGGGGGQASTDSAAEENATDGLDPLGADGAGQAADGEQDGAAGAFTFPEDTDPLLADQPYVEDELLVQAVPGAESADLNALFAEVGATVIEEYPELGAVLLGVDSGELTAIAGTLADSPLIEAVQKNYTYEPAATPNDPEYFHQDYLESLGLTRAWDTTTGDAEIVVAVLDTGVDPDHPDLTAKLVPGWDTYADTADTDDVHGHGTAVAGVLAAASNNSIGVAGVTWESPIMPVRVTNGDGEATTHTAAAGLVWAINHGATVANISFGPLASDRTVLRASRYVRSAGGLVFISAGNDGESNAAAANANAVFVGATNDPAEIAYFSSRGPYVDLVAPGTMIRATSRGGKYETVSGTSFSSPIAAGVAALVWSVRPELRPATVQQILAETATDLGTPGRDENFGDGLVNAEAAVARALEIVEENDVTKPSVAIVRPTDGEAVSGIVRVTATAEDDNEIADVQLAVDGAPLATDTDEPYRFVINTAGYAAGPHTITCTATDEAGNSSTPASIQVAVGDSSTSGGASGADTTAPSVVINYPVDGTVVIGSVGVKATATDNAGLAKIEWRVDGATQQTTKVSGVQSVNTFVWNSATYAPGPHTIAVLATDAVGNQGIASVSLVKE